jgi:hypothetical protein
MAAIKMPFVITAAAKQRTRYNKIHLFSCIFYVNPGTANNKAGQIRLSARTSLLEMSRCSTAKYIMHLTWLIVTL